MTPEAVSEVPLPGARSAFVRGDDRVTALRRRADLAAAVEAKRARIRQAEDEHALGIAAVRNAARLTQAELAAVLGVGQAAIAKIEGRPDILLSTLRSYINGAGGHARLVVYFPDSDREVELNLDAETNQPDGPAQVGVESRSGTVAPRSDNYPEAKTTQRKRGTAMSGPEKRIVQKRPEGGYEVRSPGSKRASAVTRTQAEGIDRAREILANGGGGELQVRGRDGTIRKQDTVHPGSDPRNSKG